MACSVFDNNYNTQYILNDINNIHAQNIYGYLLYDVNTQMIEKCDENTCIAKYKQEYFDQLAQQGSSSSEFADIANNNNITPKYNNKSIIVIVFILLTIITLLMCYLYSSQYQKIGKVKQQQKTTIFVSDECTPLLKQ